MCPYPNHIFNIILNTVSKSIIYLKNISRLEKNWYAPSWFENAPPLGEAKRASAPPWDKKREVTCVQMNLCSEEHVFRWTAWFWYRQVRATSLEFCCPIVTCFDKTTVTSGTDKLEICFVTRNRNCSQNKLIDLKSEQIKEIEDTVKNSVITTDEKSMKSYSGTEENCQRSCGKGRPR